MPTVLRIAGFSVRIYTADHNPMHVHVFSANGEAVIVIGKPARLMRVQGMSDKDVRAAVALVEANAERPMPRCWRRNGRRSMVTDAEIIAAREAGSAHAASVPHAVTARFIRSRRALHVALSNGVEMTVPVDLVQGLTDAAVADLAEIEITPAGTGLHWPRLDADVLVEGLVHGIYGSRQWMASTMGRAGGASTSDAKADAARRNGAKGGRPKKVA